MDQNTTRLTLSDLRAAMGASPFDGRAAQRSLEPIWRGPAPAHAAARPPREAAALAYVYEEGGALFLPLTVRRHDLREHGGQVSLPGGRPADGETLEATAWREAAEEVGLNPATPESLGALAPVHITVSHTTMHVFVACGPAPLELTPQPSEVERIVIVGLDDLIHPTTRKRRVMEIHGREIDVPWLDVGGVFLWGATAMALGELAERLRAV